MHSKMIGLRRPAVWILLLVGLLLAVVTGAAGAYLALKQSGSDRSDREEGFLAHGQLSAAPPPRQDDGPPAAHLYEVLAVALSSSASARKAGSDPHQHRRAGKSQTRPVVRPLLGGLGRRPPQGVGTRTGGARPVLCGRAVGILHAGMVSRPRGEDAQGRALCGARP